MRSSAISYTRRFIAQLDTGELFTTRDLLGFGSRAAIDQCIYRLVKSSRILRVMRGVFIRNDPGIKLPPIEAVAKVKIESFGRKFFMAPVNAARKLQIEEGNHDETIYATDGNSTAFHYNGVRITVVGLAQRKLAFGDTRVGLAIRAMWHLGESRLSEPLFCKAMHSFFRPDKEQIRKNIGILPSWIAEFFTCKSVFWRDRKRLSSLTHLVC